MILKPFIGLLLLLNAGVTFAQFGGSPERSAIRNIEKHRWQKAEIKLRKTLGKDSLNPGIRYALSLFFFHRENPAFHLDSAYHYAVTALDDYALSSTRDRGRLRRMAVDSMALIGLRAKIDSTAFEIARKVNTEAAYLKFLSHFPLAAQRGLAEQMRDEAAFQEALKENTHQAFLSYLNRYPDARRALEARARYDRLVYEAETKDQRLSSYERFLAKHPKTPYRKEISQHIFEISTADGTVESFLNFAARYPASDLAKKARQMVFHILIEADDPQWPSGFLNDSLRHVMDLNKTFLVPVLKNDLYGFMDQAGKVILPPVFQSIHPDYLCGYITDEILILGNRLINRSGTLVYRGKVEELTDLGMGFLKIRSGNRVSIIHKAGFMWHDNVEDARILNKKFMALKKNNFWRLYTLTGRLLDNRPWDDITALHEVIVFKNGDQVFISPKNQLSKAADGVPMKLSPPLDEVKAWPGGLIWGRSGEFQGVLNQSLQGVIGFDKHILTRSFFGATAAVPNGMTIYNRTGKRSSTFEKVAIFGARVAVKKNDFWFLYDPASHQITGKRYESLRAEGPFLLGVVGDTVEIHFEGNHIAAYSRPLTVSFIPAMDSTSFLVVQENGREKTVFDLGGRKLFSTAFDALEYAGEGVFVVTKKDKKGLLDMAGENLLSPEFDAIGSARDGVLSILKNRKFGAYSIHHKRLIKPQYDRNLLPYDENLMISFKGGYYGFSGWLNKPLSAFEFDEIRYWKDSVALVRKGLYWSFYDIASGKITESFLRKVIMVKNSFHEKVAIVQKDNLYGVISNGKRILIPATFTDIVNIGSPEEPLYFTEKHLKEAALFVVMYYDQDGKVLRKEIYDDARVYDKIYCSE